MLIWEVMKIANMGILRDGQLFPGLFSAQYQFGQVNCYHFGQNCSCLKMINDLDTLNFDPNYEKG